LKDGLKERWNVRKREHKKEYRTKEERLNEKKNIEREEKDRTKGERQNERRKMERKKGNQLRAGSNFKQKSLILRSVEN
jgi:hypothetical protein